MPVVTLVVGASIALVSATLFTFVGRAVMERSPKGEAKVAAGLFAAWWYLLAISTAGPAILSLLAAFGYAPLVMHKAVTDLVLVAISAGLGGLLYYLIYIYTGKTSSLWPVMIGYGLYALVLLIWIEWGDPSGVHLRRWATEIVYRNQLSGSPLALVLTVLLVGPQLVAALAYLSLYWRIEGRERRYRVLLVSLAIIVWFGSSLVGSIAGLSNSDAWQLTTRLIGLSAAGVILIAFRPPAIVRAWIAAAPSNTQGSDAWPAKGREGAGRH